MKVTMLLVFVDVKRKIAKQKTFMYFNLVSVISSVK